MGDLGLYFNRSEFACKCGCGFDDVESKLVAMLDALREKLGRPVRITSGCRCRDHNLAVGGDQGSSHLYGHAADIACDSGKERWDILEAMIVYLPLQRIGIGKDFIHVDICSDGCDKPFGVIWHYY